MYYTGKNGAPERIRTSDPQIRSLVLYPAELRAPRGAGCSLTPLRPGAGDLKPPFRVCNPAAAPARQEKILRHSRQNVEPMPMHQPRSGMTILKQAPTAVFSRLMVPPCRRTSSAVTAR